jgi:hypothetical protein
MYRAALAVFLLPGALAAQAILQNSIATTSGTLAGSILGKHLSNTLEHVKKATDESAAADQATDEARRNERKRDEWKRLTPGSLRIAKKELKPAAPVSQSLPEPLIGPSVGSPSVTTPRSWRSGSAGKPAMQVGSVSLDDGTAGRGAYLPPAEPIQPSASDLRAVNQGTTRDDVIDRLGSPVARVTIPEEGRFVEVYYYHSKGEPVGAVRLSNGTVTEVQLNR